MDSIVLPMFRHEGMDYMNIKYIQPGEWFGQCYLLTLQFGNHSAPYIIEAPDPETAIEEFTLWCVEHEDGRWVSEVGDSDRPYTAQYMGMELDVPVAIVQCHVRYTADYYTTISTPDEDNDYELDNEVIHNQKAYDLYDIMRMLQDEGYMKRSTNDGTNWWETEPWMNPKGVYTSHSLHMTDGYGQPMCRHHSVFEWLNKQIS